MKRHSEALPVFRLFAILWLGLFLLGGGILLVSKAFSLSAPVFYLAGIANAILLLGYLLWTPLQRHLGTKYLPIGVIVASAGPIIINHLVSLPQIYPSALQLCPGIFGYILFQQSREGKSQQKEAPER